MVRLHDHTLNPERARREVAAALLGRDAPALDETHAGIAVTEHVAPLLAKGGARFANAAAAAIVADRARIDATRTTILDDELRRVYGALATAGLSPVVIKGAHVAHTVYPDPLQRPRSDTDLLIDPADRDAIDAMLRDCGYRPAVHVRGSIILGQFHFERRDRSGVMHFLDVHWRVAAPLVVDRVLPARDVLNAARPLPALGGNARGPALEDALALGCIHVVSHHWPHLELRWAYDFRLLLDALGTAGEHRFVAAAHDRGYGMIAAHAFAAAGSLLEDSALQSVADRLARGAESEATAALLGMTRPADRLWLDLRTAGWRDRVRLLREHLLPDRAYMIETGGAQPLPLAYTRRAWSGMRRWLSATASDRTGE